MSSAAEPGGRARGGIGPGGPGEAPGPADQRPPRPEAHAGTFYPADPDQLEREVEALIRDADLAARHEVPLPRPPLGLLVPHAALHFSGRVAAHGWRQVRELDPATVVIAGTNHFAAWFAGVGVWAGGAWQTPLGPRAVDDELGAATEGLGRPFVPTVDAHLDEHSIEVQLPLLAAVVPRSRIVPLLVSLPDPAACREAGRWLGLLLRDRLAAGERVVLVASSDLAHYPTESRAHEIDRQVLEPILALDPWQLARRELELRRSGIRGLACGLCGFEPVLFTLAAVREMGARRGILLAHGTSADVPGGDPGRVVGYAAVEFVA